MRMINKIAEKFVAYMMIAIIAFCIAVYGLGCELSLWCLIPLCISIGAIPGAIKVYFK